VRSPVVFEQAGYFFVAGLSEVGVPLANRTEIPGRFELYYLVCFLPKGLGGFPGGNRHSEYQPGRVPLAKNPERSAGGVAGGQTIIDDTYVSSCDRHGISVPPIGRHPSGEFF
jgi:hypothetical protein